MADANEFPLLMRAIGHECPYCLDEMQKDGPKRPSRDHIRPKMLGADLNGGNRVIVCTKCNSDKNDKTLHQWLNELLRAGDSRAGVVADLICDLFLDHPSEHAHMLVGMPRVAKKGGKCKLPNCTCVGACEAGGG